MIIYGITMDDCHKCDFSKERLKQHHIEWIDVSSEVGKELIEKHDIVFTPTFIILDGDKFVLKTCSILKIENFIKGERNID